MPVGADVTEAAGSSGLAGALPPKSMVPSKRERILEGMLEAVGKTGYETTSVRTVLDQTGLYRQAFYDNFADRDSCYLEALDFGIARIESLLALAAAEETTWPGKMRAGLGALLDFLDAQPSIGRALIVEIHAAGPDALAKRTAVMERAASFIDLARRESGDAKKSPLIAAEGIAAGINSVIYSRLSTGTASGFRELLPEFMYFAVLPYFGSEAASDELQGAGVATS
ncbi:MAG: TetR/AcrR family transcriptional regulator [Solirubrobacterales bacterium]